MQALSSKYGGEQQGIFSRMKLLPIKEIPKLLVRMLVSSKHQDFEES